MAIAIRGTGSVVTIPANGSSVSLPVTTNAGDCIYVAVSVAGADENILSFSGAGATWISRLGSSTSPSSEVYIGYNASAGQTTITLNGSVANGSVESMVVVVLSGCATASSPVDHSFISGLSANGSSSSVGPVSCTNGDFLLSNLAAANPTAWTGSASWSAGFSNNVVASDVSAGQRCLYLCSTTATSTGSTSFTTVGNSGNNQYAVILVALSVPAGPPPVATNYLDQLSLGRNVPMVMSTR